MIRSRREPLLEVSGRECCPKNGLPGATTVTDQVKGQLSVDKLWADAQDGISDFSHWVQELVGQESDCSEKRYRL